MRPLFRKFALAADFQRFHQTCFFSIILIFLLCGQITRQAIGLVVAVPCRPQPLQEGFQVVFHVAPHHLAALDYRVHERVVPGRSLASDVPCILQLVVNFWTHFKVKDITISRPVARPIIVRFFVFLVDYFLLFYAGDSLRCPRCFLPPVTTSSKKSPKKRHTDTPASFTVLTTLR